MIKLKFKELKIRKRVGPTILWQSPNKAILVASFTPVDEIAIHQLKALSIYTGLFMMSVGYFTLWTNKTGFTSTFSTQSIIYIIFIYDRQLDTWLPRLAKRVPHGYEDNSGVLYSDKL